MKTYRNLLILSILPLFSLFVCFIQSQYIYDGFHWGLNAVIAENILSEKWKHIYEDFFIHYSLLPNIIQSFFYKYLDFGVLSLILSTAVFFSLGNFFLTLIIYKKTNINFAISFSVILFLLHPSPIYPWHNYFFFSFITIGVYFIYNKKKYTLAGFFFGLALLCYENFIIVCLTFLIVYLISRYHYFKKINFLEKNYIDIFLGFLLVLVIFYSMILFYDKERGWLEVFTLNDFFMDIYNVTYLTLITNFFVNYFFKIKNFPGSFSFIVFALLFFFNVIFLINNFVKKKNFNDVLLSFFSCMLLITSLHDIDVFRLSTGFVLSVIILVNFLKNCSNYQIYLNIIIIFLFGNILSYENEANKFVPKSYFFSDFSNNKNNKHFKYQKWPKDTWIHLDNVEFYHKKIAKNCSLDNLFFINYTLDAYYFLIFNDLKSFQNIPWYNKDKVREGLMKKFNPNFNKNFEKFFKSGNLLVVLNEYHLHKFNSDSLKKYKSIKLPFSYHNKSKLLLIPQTCYNKI